MRYRAAEKREIIDLVEHSSLPVRRTLNRLGIPRSTVYRLLKAHDLITSPAFVLMKAADKFQHPTTAPNQLWQTDFTYLKVIGWGW